MTKQQWDSTCAVHPTAAEELVTMREKYVPADLGWGARPRGPLGSQNKDRIARFWANRVCRRIYPFRVMRY